VLNDRILSKQQELDELEARRQDYLNNIEATRKKEQIKIEEIQRYDNLLQESAVTIEILKSELTSLGDRLLSNENKIREIKKETDDMEKQLLERVSKEALLLDQANSQFREAQKFNISSLQQSSQPKIKGPEHKTSTMTKKPDRNSGVFDDDESFKPKSFGLVQLPTKSMNQFQVSQSEINALRFSPNGVCFVTGGNDATLRIWDSVSGRSKAVYTGPEKTITAIDFAANDEYILASSCNNSAIMWSLYLGRVVHNLTGHRNEVTTAKFSFDSQKIITGSKDRTIRTWDSSRGYVVKSIDCESSPNDLSITRDGNVVVSGHMDYAMRFYDVRTGTKIHACNQQNFHKGQVTGIDISPDGRSVLTSARDKKMILTDFRNYHVINTYEHSDFSTNTNSTRCCFSTDGSYVVSGSSDGAVYIWNTKTGEIAKILKPSKDGIGHTKSVNCVAWNPNGTQLASGDKNGLVVLWG